VPITAERAALRRPPPPAPGDIAAMSFNWRKFEAWRKHPMLVGNMRHSMPGLGIGTAAFLVYAAADQLFGGKGKH
jgi:NADH dehydrogenase (ubiquinone) 1 beta subcomplex subunit 3